MVETRGGSGGEGGLSTEAGGYGRVMGAGKGGGVWVRTAVESCLLAVK